MSLRENRKPAAEHFYRSALRAGSSSAPLLNKLANLLAQRGLSAEAEECYRKALALDPGFADAHFNLGSACGRAGRTQDALHHLRQAVALKPSFKEAWETLAMISGGGWKPARGFGLLGTGAATGSRMDQGALGVLSHVAENGSLAGRVGFL